MFCICCLKWHNIAIMKKRVTLFLFPGLITALVSCGLPSIDWGVSSKNIGVYDLFAVRNSQNKADYFRKEATFFLKEGEEALPYLSLDAYQSLLSTFLKTGYASSVKKDGRTLVWDVKNPEDKLIFRSVLSPDDETLAIAGSLSNAFAGTETDYSKTSLFVQSTFESTVAKEGQNYSSYTYADLGYKPFTHNGAMVYPLSFFDAAYAKTVGFHAFYNYNSVYLFDNYEMLKGNLFASEGVEPYSVFDEMKKYASTNWNHMPLYLRKDRLSSFYYLFANHYGLAYTRGIESMKSLIDGSGVATAFLKEDEDARCESMFRFIANLNDGHTAVASNSASPWQTKSYPRYGALWTDRIALHSSLQEGREKAYQAANKQEGEVLYSSNGKLAFFNFEGFTFDMNAFDENNKLREDLWKSDTYFFLNKRLGEIKAKGGVTDIVLDISTNGGGTVGVMMKMLSLLSKDNLSTIYMFDTSSLAIGKENTKVDSNGDGKFNTDDVYGNDFKFHILTSPYSFSCGNAFPFYAKKSGFADLWGVNSGGGECSVGQYFLPSGELIGHSSNSHIGWYANDIWEGDEAGAGNDLPLAYSQYFDLEELAKAI